MRAIWAALLMVVAAVLAVGAVAGFGVDRLARTAEPARQIAGPLADDPRLRDALAAELSARLLEQVPDRAGIPAVVAPLLERAASEAVSTALAEPDFRGAWLETVDLTRERYVARLEAVGAGNLPGGAGSSATAALELRPLAVLGHARLQEAADRFGLGPLVEPLGDRLDISVELGVPDPADVAPETLAGALRLSAQWGWWAVASAVAALASLLLANARGRWWVLALGGTVVAVLGGAALALASRAASGAAASGAADPGDGAGRIEALVGHTLVEGLATQAVPLAWWTLVAGCAVAAIGVALRVLRRPAATR
jgi:hypothetical protein